MMPNAKRHTQEMIVRITASPVEENALDVMLKETVPRPQHAIQMFVKPHQEVDGVFLLKAKMPVLLTLFS